MRWYKHARMLQSEAKTSSAGGWNHMSSLFKSKQAHDGTCKPTMPAMVLDRLTAYSYSDICKSQQVSSQIEMPLFSFVLRSPPKTKKKASSFLQLSAKGPTSARSSGNLRYESAAVPQLQVSSSNVARQTASILTDSSFTGPSFVS